MNEYHKNIVLLVLGVIALHLIVRNSQSEVKRLSEELEQARTELARAAVPVQRDTIRDTVEVVTQAVVEVTPRRLREALAADERLIKDLKLKVRQLEAMQTTTLETSDTVPAQYQPRDSCFYYSDQWADLSLQLKDTTFYYNIRDSLATVVYREYRHHFLWWKWGTKGYRVKIVNFNPHARVTYNKYIKAER
ncbi:MAG: hypothetical protein IJ546_08610 [Prevotella sp.]|nr:hypothetical protein [Prevotella sp.]